ncbi:hypothetical protein Tcan_08378 [Toxocara canis]|uniref:BED-type domain-containing protein n=1 Tax=Toxocara canis TaxID=6265 RepID=A0A0B2VU04_TOXCA|nr:hypothetical protein Tcan_08378 [Toxocara canis]
MGEPETALEQGSSRSLSHRVWQFYEVVQGSYKCPRCGGREVVGLDTMNAMKHLKTRHEAEYAELVAKEMGWDMQMITKSIKLYEGLFRITKPIRDQTEAHEESAGANLARCVNKEFKRRIAKVIDPHSPDFDPIYVVFTILGPNNACLVYGGLKEVAETALLSMARVEDENANSLYIADAPAELLDHPMMLEQTAKFGEYAKAHEESAVAHLARCVNKEFKRRVAKVIDPHSPDFDLDYVVATVLDPNIACLVDDGLKEVAESALLSMARVEDENANSLYIADAPAELLDHPMMLEQTAKFGEYAKANAVGSDSLKSAIAAYVASMFYELLHSAINPIAYWETEKRMYFVAVTATKYILQRSSEQTENVCSTVHQAFRDGDVGS